MKNIGFGKLGKSVKFIRNKYSPIGGDNEASCTLRAMANLNPDKTFYIIGRTDYGYLNEAEQHDIFPYNNVVDVWNKRSIGPEHYNQDYYDHVKNYLKDNNVELDYTVLMVGQVGSVTIPDRIIKVNDPDAISSVLDMTKGYTTGITSWLNDCKPKYVEIVNDPRYVMNQARDIFHLPEMSLGQYDYEYISNKINSYEDQTRTPTPVKSVYAGMETAFCLDYEHSTDINRNRNTDFMIVLNEGKPSRYKLLKEWILDHNKDVDIYGKWADEIMEGDTRFKGSLKIDALQDKLQDVKFTFIIPIKKGWVTSKYIEMIHAGVIPFLHPTYDEQKHTAIPDFLRVKSPEQLAERIQMLKDDPAKYNHLLELLQKTILKPEYYDGTFLNNKIMSSIDPNYVAPNLEEFPIPEKPTIGLESFF